MAGLVTNDIAITSALHELTSRHACFTGEDVFKRIHNKKIHRTWKAADVDPSLTPQDVSRFVRGMFNNRNPLFMAYGSTLVNLQNGPILYFPLPHHAKKRMRQIEAAMSATPNATSP